LARAGNNPPRPEKEEEMRKYSWPVLVAALVILLSASGWEQRTEAINPAPGFHAPVAMPGSNAGTEPSLAIPMQIRAGLRFVTWQNPGEIATSLDGVNFTNRGTRAGGGDVTNAADPSGGLFFGQFCSGGFTLHACLERSLDGAATWPLHTDIADMHPGAADRPWIEVFPHKRPTLAAAQAWNPDNTRVYMEYHTFTPEELAYVTVSADGGHTFSEAKLITSDTNALVGSGCNTVPGGIGVDESDGTIYALWLSGNDVASSVATGCNYSQIGPFNKAWVSRSTDGGNTWTANLAWQGPIDLITKIGDNADKIFATISVDESGQVHVILPVRHNDDPLGFTAQCQMSSTCEETPQDTDLLLVTSPDKGAHWTQPVTIEGSSGSYFFPWTAAGSQGIVNAVYYKSTTRQPNKPNSIWYVGHTRVTGAVATYTTGPNANYVSPPAFQEQLLDPDPVHGNGSTGGGICTFGLFCSAVPGANRTLADSLAVTLDPAGGVNAVWTDSITPSGKVIQFTCQNSGPSSIAGAPNLNGCYGPADVSITKTDSQDPVSAGGTLTYHLTVTNNGTPAMPATTSGVTVTDVLPAGVTLVSATPSTGTCSGTGTITCDLGIFPSAATATIDIVVQVAADKTGTLTNTATVAALTNDPSPGNNTATEVTSVAAPTPCVPANVALASAGSVAVALSHPSGNFPAISAINGDRTGASWGTSSGGWNDNTRNAYPDIFEVDFPVIESIGQINVFTLQNNWTTAGQPTLASPATGEGILDFVVQYCSANCGGATPTWTTVPGGDVTGNDKAWRQFTFPAVTTSKIRVVVNNSRNNWSRIVEVEAYRSCPP
jgi:uncharacterized repeat protein (TIGR01451 family)